MPVRAGGEIPSRAAALGAGLDVLQGRWDDSPADSAYMAPTTQQLYDELDRFHIPRVADSTWGEWHYFNLATSPDEWWYITYLVGGGLVSRGPADARWGGRLLVTHRRPDGRYDRFTAEVPAAGVHLDTTRADLAIGPSTVRQRDGVYRLHAVARGKQRGRPARPRPSPPAASVLSLRWSCARTISSPGTSSPRLAASASGTGLRRRELPSSSPTSPPITITTGAYGAM